MTLYRPGPARGFSLLKGGNVSPHIFVPETAHTTYTLTCAACLCGCRESAAQIKAQPSGKAGPLARSGWDAADRRRTGGVLTGRLAKRSFVREGRRQLGDGRAASASKMADLQTGWSPPWIPPPFSSFCSSVLSDSGGRPLCPN